MAQSYKVRLKIIPPIASHPKDGRKIRLVVDGEFAIPIRKVQEGLLVSLESDDYLAVINEDELIKYNGKEDEE